MTPLGRPTASFAQCFVFVKPTPLLLSDHLIGHSASLTAAADQDQYSYAPNFGTYVISSRYPRNSHGISTSISTTVAFAKRKRRDPFLPPDPNEPPSNPLFELLASSVAVASTQIPLPLIGDAGAAGTSISLGYPLFLASAFLLLPATTSILLCVFFIGYWSLGRSVIGDSELDGMISQEDQGIKDEEISADSNVAVSDLLALAGSIASAGLLSPDGFATSAASGGILSESPRVGVGLLVVASLSIIASLVKQSEVQARVDDDERRQRANERLMDIWDDNFSDRTSRDDE